MSTGSTATPSKQVTLNHFGPATITKVAGGFRVVADGGASADFTCDRGDVTVTNCVNCGEGFMRSALASAWSKANYVAPASAPAPVTVTIPLSRKGQREYDEAMAAEQDGMNRRILGRMGFRAVA